MEEEINGVKKLVKATLMDKLGDTSKKYKEVKVEKPYITTIDDIIDMPYYVFEDNKPKSTLVLAKDNDFDPTNSGSAPTDLYCRVAPLGSIRTHKLTDIKLGTVNVINFINGILALEYNDIEKGALLDDTRTIVETIKWYFNPLHYIPLLVEIISVNTPSEVEAEYDKLVLSNSVRLNTIFLVNTPEPYIVGAYDIELGKTKGSTLIDLLSEVEK